MTPIEAKFICHPSPARLREMAQTGVDAVIRSALLSLADAYEVRMRPAQ